MAVLTVQQVVRAGLGPVFAAAAGGGDEFVNTGVEYLEVINGSGADITVTIVTPNTVDGLAVTDRAVVVTAGERRKIGPFPTSIYNNSNSKVNVTYSSATSVTVGLFKV